jgi:ABC-2 type transport system permease protein
MVVGIVVGTRAISGEESRRTMGLLLANPVKRSTIVLEKTITMVLCVAITGVATFLGIGAGSLIGGLDMDMGNIAAACLLVSLLGLAFGTIALALAALTGKSKIAAFGSTGVALVSYITASFLPLNDTLAGYAKWSPYYYFQSNETMLNGMDWRNAAVYGGIIIVMVALSVWFFQRRDLRYNG